MKLLIPGLLLLASCAHAGSYQRPPKDFWAPFDLPIFVRIDRHVPDDAAAHVETAVEYWNMVLDREVFSLVPRDGMGVIVVDTCSRHVLDCLYPHNVGLFTRRNNVGRIWIRKDRPHMERTMIHEFGHALGLGHHSNKEHIMFRETHGGPYFIDSRALDMVNERLQD